MTTPATRWPNLFLVGAAKAGTTSLYELLGRHPSIFMSRLKEPHYFAEVFHDPTQAFLMRPVRERRAYLALFASGAGQRWRGEASPSYLWDRSAATRIHKVIPNARVVIMLRDPVERAYSHYLMDVREGIQRLSLRDALHADRRAQPKAWGGAHLYVELGFYYESVRRYFEVFGRERVFVGLFEEFAADPQRMLGSLFDWLGVEPCDVTAGGRRPARVNRYAVPRSGAAARVLGSPMVRRLARVVPRPLRTAVRGGLLRRPREKPPIDPRAVELLEARYAEDRVALERLLGRRLPWRVAVGGEH